MGAKGTIFVVDPSLREDSELITGLATEGYVVSLMESGEELFDFLRHAIPTAIFTELELPGIDGFTLCRRISDDPAFRSISLIVFSDRQDENIISRCLEEGADNYMHKAAHIETAIALMESVRRRREPEANISPILKVGNLTLDRQAHELYLFGQRLEISLLCLKVMEALMINVGKKVSVKYLFKVLYGTDPSVPFSIHNVHNKVRDLRKALGDHAYMIASKYGQWYWLVVPTDETLTKQLTNKVSRNSALDICPGLFLCYREYFIIKVKLWDPFSSGNHV